MTLLNRSRAERILDQEKLDGLLATTLENVYYLSNVWCDNFLVLPRQTQFYALAAGADLETPAVTCSISEAANVLATSPANTRLIPWGQFYRFVQPPVQLSQLDLAVKKQVVEGLEASRSGPEEALVEALQKLKLDRGRVAYDENGLFPAPLRQQIRDRLPGLEWVPGASVFRRIRAVKTGQEVERLQGALRLTEKAIRAAMDIARPGTTEKEMVVEFEQTVIAGGGRPLLTQIYFGPHGSSGYVCGRDGVLAPGEVIRFDVGCLLDGYTSDIARNFSLGEPAAGQRVIGYYQAILAGETAAIEQLRPGVQASRIFETAVAAAREAGIAHYNRSHVGHGIGLEMYDPPHLRPDDATELEAGMVLNVETPYYELGFPGLQVEDTVLVEETGARLLTRLDRSFRVV